MKDDIILKMKDISKRFPGVLALDHADLEILKGEVHILLGENGAGKSTLIKILAGAYERDSGEIWFEGKAIEHLSPKQIQDLGISTIYQEFNLVPHLDAAENIFLGREPAKRGILDNKALYADAEELIERIGLKIDVHKRVSELSVAEQQMVEVAKALSVGARILIMDEPTATLTEKEITNLFKTIRIITEQGTSVIYISHRMEEFEMIGNRITIMRDGRTLQTVKVGEMELNDMIGLMAGREITDQYPPYRANPRQEILEVSNMSTKKVKNISFTLCAGEILGFSGLVGSGRTEVARAIIGVDPLESGSIKVFGEKVQICSPKEAILHSIAYLPESRKEEGLILKMGVQDNITIAALSEYEKFFVLDNSKEQQAAESYRSSLGIKAADLKQQVQDLSGGNQQKVVMAKWLLSKCKIMIFDEPTRGIDAGAKYEIYKLIQSLAASGTAVIVISSDLPEVINLSTRVLVMRRGEIAGILEREDISQEKILKYAALGGESDGE